MRAHCEEDYFQFNPELEYDDNTATDLEWALTDLQSQGILASLELRGPDSVRVSFCVPSCCILEEATVKNLVDARLWLCDQGVRHCRAFAQQHALWLGPKYAPAASIMREYGCTCPETPNIEETGTYIVYKKCPIYGSR